MLWLDALLHRHCSRLQNLQELELLRARLLEWPGTGTTACKSSAARSPLSARDGPLPCLSKPMMNLHLVAPVDQVNLEDNIPRCYEECFDGLFGIQLLCPWRSWAGRPY